MFCTKSVNDLLVYVSKCIRCVCVSTAVFCMCALVSNSLTFFLVKFPPDSSY